VAVEHRVRGSASGPHYEERENRREPTRQRAARRGWEWTRSILAAFVLFLMIRTFLVEAFRIPTGSMENTLLVGDFLLVNKAIFGGRVPFTRLRLPAFAAPRRGDVVVFTPPHDPGRSYVKRLVAAAGDTVEMREKTLIVNGRAQREPYARHDDPGDVRARAMVWQCAYRTAAPGACAPSRDSWGPLIVPEDRYLVLGDNRDDSEDSRYWGFVPREAIRGRPLFVYYSFEPGSPRPMPWITGVRWHRIGAGIH
jgi:signal peptidase I